MGTRSAGGSFYSVTMIDDCTRYKGLMPLKSKGQAKDAVIKEVNDWAAKTGHRVTIVRSEGGMEYTGKKWPNWLRDKVLQHQTNTRYSPQQSGWPRDTI